MDSLDRLEAFVGEWRVEAFGHEGRTTFEWVLGRRFLLQRSEMPTFPAAPAGLSIYAPDGDGYTQHYFDSRGVVRLYAMTFDGREWTLTRDAADFSELPFRQRYTGAFDEDGAAIRGRWERTGDDGEWQLDFELAYDRVG